MGRRAKGEGSIYRRKDGRWVGEYYDANGRRRYVSGKSKRDTSVRLARAIAEREFDAQNLTLAEYLGEWLDSIRGTMKVNSWRRHEINIRVHINPILGGVKFDRLNPSQLQRFYTAKLDSGLSAATVIKLHTTLNKALKQAVRWRLVPRNVAGDVSRPQIPREEIRPLTAEQVNALLHTAREDKLYSFYVLAVTTGARIGELAGLRWDDIDLEARTMKVRRTVYGNSVSSPKTPSSIRTIRLCRRATAVLKDHREISNGCEWVFATSRGNLLNLSNVRNRSWKALKRKAGIPETTRLHDLRHTCATLLLGRGVPLKVVAEMLGHADASTTLRVYAHILPSMQYMAADEMDDALS